MAAFPLTSSSNAVFYALTVAMQDREWPRTTLALVQKKYHPIEGQKIDKQSE
jgi:hypothetical protein